ncbi:MAG: PIN domain-containing protein [Candidatus Hodarchaeales archaeon]
MSEKSEMVERACLDAGPISLYYQKDPKNDIITLFNSINMDKIQAVVPASILVEVYKHLCVAKGNKYAENCIRSFQHGVKVEFVPLTAEAVIEAGKLKCQYRRKLSYNDCIVVTVALAYKATLHTTEKELGKIKNLRVTTYEF